MGNIASVVSFPVQAQAPVRMILAVAAAVELAQPPGGSTAHPEPAGPRHAEDRHHSAARVQRKPVAWVTQVAAARLPLELVVPN